MSSRMFTSRRRPYIVAAVVLSVAMVALAGCSGSSGGGGSSNSKAITLVFTDEPTSLDPCDTRPNGNSLVVMDNIIETLTTVDPSSGEVKPVLSTAWTQTNPTTWAFTLRKGVKFQDGSNFNAAAVVAAINRTLTPSLNCQDLALFSGETLTTTAVDDSRVQVVTSKPDPILPTRLSYVAISSPKTPATKTQKPVGTGPYKFVSYTQGQQLQVKRFAGYWGAAPQVASATYVWRAQDSVRASMVKTGAGDIGMGIAQQEANSATEEYSNNEVVNFRPNLVVPLNDVRVRQAISLSINRDQITSKLMPKTGKPTNQLVTNLINGFIPDYQGDSYDPAKAKQLLAAAKADGVPVDTQITFIERAQLFPGSDDVMAAIVSDMQAVGLNIKPIVAESTEWFKYLSKPFPKNEPPQLFIVSHDNTTGDAVFSFPDYMGGDGQYSYLNDPQLNTLLNEATVAAGDKRAQLFQEAAKRSYQLEGMIPMISLSSLLMTSDRVNYKPNGLTNLVLPLAKITFK